MCDPEMSGHEVRHLQAPADAVESSGSSPPKEELPGALASLEEELTREVPSLLESMNRTSTEVNMFEARAGEAQQRYQELLAEWSRMYETLHSQFGSAIDRVKPYFDAAQVFSAASQRVQSAVREFSAASSQHSRAKKNLREMEEKMESGAQKVLLDKDQQDELARATVDVLHCQQERDRLEAEYVRMLKEYQKSQEDLEAWRALIGDATIKRTLPCFRQLHQQQLKLAAEQSRINTFHERAKVAKSSYNTTMRALERISDAVHIARQEHSKAAPASPTVAPAACPRGQHKVEGLQQPESSPEDTPELAPEVARVFGEEYSKPEGAKAGAARRSPSTTCACAEEDDGPFA